MAYNQTTEWEDIQVKHGNYIPTKITVDNNQAEKDNLNNYLEQKASNLVSNKEDNLNNSNSQDSFGLDDYDEEFEKQYKLKKMQEYNIYNNELTSKHYEILNIINMDEYKRLILDDTNKNKVIILILYQDHVPKSMHFVSEIKNYFKQNITNESYFIKTEGIISLLKIKSTDCISDFKDEHTPTMLIYNCGIILKKFINCYDNFITNENSLNCKMFNKEVIELIKRIFNYNNNKKLNQVNFINNFESTYKSTYKDNNYISNDSAIRNDREYYWKAK